MRTFAKVGERTLCVGGDGTVLELVYKLALVLLTFVAEEFKSILF